MVQHLKKIKWDERNRVIAGAGICGVVLILAMLLPLPFRRAAAPKEPVEGAGALEKKAAMFAEFWQGGSVTLTVERLNAPPADVAGFCGETMAALTARCIDDRAAESTAPTGSEYTVVTGPEGQLRLCRMWLQTRGDWQNWLDVCFDAETGFVYYLYVSRECLTNQNLYVRAGEDRPTGASVAAGLAAETGGELLLYQPDTGEGHGAAVIRAPEGTLCWELDSTYYDELIDVAIRVM